MNAEKEKQAVEVLRFFNRETEPYYLCYSGGKDSDVIRILAEIAGVNYEIHNNHTTVDAPETVRYIRKVAQVYGDKKTVIDEDTGKPIDAYGDKFFIHYPQRTMWQLIADKGMPPTRIARYCCAELKEKGGFGRRKVTGVRWAESAARRENQGLVTIIGKGKTVAKLAEEKNANFTLTNKGGVVLNTDNAEEREVVENCYRTTSTLINPIIDWTGDDVWEFLKHYGCESNPLYCDGEKRIGCVGCPLSGFKRMKNDFKRYPAYRRAYVNAFEKMLERAKEKGKIMYDPLAERWWKDGESVMRWWIGDNPIQITFDDFLKMQDAEAKTMDEYI